MASVVADEAKSRSMKPSVTNLLYGSAEIFSLLGFGQASDKSELACENSHVLCAVLEDSEETVVRLGSTRYNSSTQTYQMLDGPIQISASSRDEDGLYRTSSGVYAIMTESEFAESTKLCMRNASESSAIETHVTHALAPDDAFVLPPSASLLSSNVTQEIGCHKHANTRTVIVAGNFEGDSTSLDVVMQQSKVAVKTAVKHGNQVCYAFLGNVVPDLHSAAQSQGDSDSMHRIVAMAQNGILNEGVKPENVTLIAGGRELAWLRLANTSESREIDLISDDDGNHGNHETQMKTQMKTLLEPTIFSDSVKNFALFNLPSWQTHNQSLKMLESRLDYSCTRDALSVLMFLKLLSVTKMTMNAPGLVRAFAAKDTKVYDFINRIIEVTDSVIETGVTQLFVGEPSFVLNDTGVILAPAAKEVVSSVLKYATSVYKEYMKKAKIIHHIAENDNIPNDDGSGNGGLWLTSRGTNGGEMVGKMPISAGGDNGKIVIAWKGDDNHSPTNVQWAIDLNTMFTAFFSSFQNGNVNKKLYEVFVAMSFDAREQELPLALLRSKGDANSSCQGVVAHASAPFGTIQRCIEVKKNKITPQKPDIVRILESWCNVNTSSYTPSTYWSVATWCSATAGELKVTPNVSNDATQPSAFVRNINSALRAILSYKIDSFTVGEILQRENNDGSPSDMISGIVGPVVEEDSVEEDSVEEDSVEEDSATPNQSMRLVSFTAPKINYQFVVTLPEQFIAYSLSYYNYDYQLKKPPGAPTLFSEGVLPLPESALVSQTSENEYTNLGIRVWALRKSTSEAGNTTLSNTDNTTRLRTRLMDSDPYTGLNVAVQKVNFENMTEMQTEMQTEMLSIGIDVTELQRRLMVFA